jgi:hypothetical protein
VPPSIVTQPASQTVLAGNTAAFNVGALGAAPINYQWSHAGTNIPGATSATLTVPNAYYTDAGNYQVTVANGIGSPANSAIATLTVAAPPTFANLTNDLVVHLKFDGNELDSSGRGNHGTYVGATNLVPGKLGSAYEYTTIVSNGTYNYVSLGTPTDLQFDPASDLSVAYWAKFTGTPGDLPFLCSAANSWGGFGLTFAPSYGGGGWSYYLNSDATDVGLYGPDDTINDGNWHSLVHTFARGGSINTYLDGVLVDTRSMAGVGNFDSGLPFNIGQDPTGFYAEDAVGAIDDIGIWRRALNAAEAQSIYLVGQNYGRSFDTYGPVLLTLKKAGSNLEIIWQTGTLQSADNVEGPYTNVGGATAPYHVVTPGAAKKFYRVQL